MPSHLHEMLIEMFRERPALAADLLAGPLGVSVPPFEEARVSSGELTDITPTEYRADAVITFRRNGAEVLAVVAEVQLRVDARKRRSWPAYVATLYARLGCPVMLLVLCPDPAVAEWCAAPIPIGQPGLVLTPLVMGPGDVPVVDDATAAKAHPELAVLSALAHGAGSRRHGVLQALLVALGAVDRDHASLYADVVLTVLPQAARDYLEALMSVTDYEFQSDYFRRLIARAEAEVKAAAEAEGRAAGEAAGRAAGEAAGRAAGEAAGRAAGEAAGRAAGEAEGRATAVLTFLEARGIEVPTATRERIAGCTDLTLLDIWVRRAVTVATADELFDERD